MGDSGGSRVASWRYRCYVGAQALSVIGTMMGYAALYWLTIHLAHGHAWLLSALVAAQFLPMLVASRQAGKLVAAHRPARVLVLTQAAQAAGALAIGIPVLAGWITIWYLCAVSVAIGWVQAVDSTARTMFMYDLVGPGELRRGSSLSGTISGLAKITGPAAAGLVIAAVGEGIVFVVDAASFLGVIAVLAVVGGRVGHEGAGQAAAAGPRRLRWLLDLPRSVQAAVVMAVLIGGVGIQFEVTNPLMATGVFHLGPLGYGLFGTLMAAGGVAGNYYSSRRPDPRVREFLLWGAAFGLAEALAAVMPDAWAYDVTMIIIGAATTLFATTSLVFAQQATPEAQRAHAVSAYNAGFLGFVPAGAFAVAALAALAGTRWALAGPGLAVAAGTAAIAAVSVRPRWSAQAAAEPARAVDP